MGKYSNLRAVRAMTKASLQSILKSPSAVFFTLAFPLVFIFVFGFVGDSKNFHFSVADAPNTDTSSSLYMLLHKVPVLKWVKAKDTAELSEMLKQDQILATVSVKQNAEGVKPNFSVQLNAIPAGTAKAQQLKAAIASIVAAMDPEMVRRQQELIEVDLHITQVRNYKTIDFILPGQIGFSLLASGVFGTAFVFFNLRQTLVLKRFFATPVNRIAIVVSEAIARLVFQIVGSIVIISIGHFVFGFTLVNGAVTFFEMLAICAMALLIFMGFGFIISGIVKNDSAIPMVSNLVTMPQLLLSGTFFGIDNFPKWLQYFCKALPLTYLNEALRKIAFDGANIWDVRVDIAVLLLWGIIVYAVAGKTFKWE
jgi:ABC-2 type transport system permease protein